MLTAALTRKLSALFRNNQLMIKNLRTISKPREIPNEKTDYKIYKAENNLVYSQDPDNFGTLSKYNKVVNDNDIIDEGDVEEENFNQNIPLSSQKLSTKQYADLIKEYLKHKRLKEAINILEVRMLVDDRVKPENYIYNILIGACAEVGYTKKAFKLYNDMKRRGLKVTGDTYTCLFNACANSPWQADGLKNASHLRQLMLEKGISPNITNYNSMIKAFGRCGDLQTAFEIVDEMKTNKIKIRVHTFNFLLQACISEKSLGLRHAILVWRKMLKMREKPNIYSFNLMLKCVKDCSLGNMKDIEELVESIQQNLLPNSQHTSLALNSNILVLSSDGVDVPENSKMKSLQKLNEHISSLPCKQTVYPNLLARCPQMQEVLSLQEVNTVQDKFAVVGAEEGFLSEMLSYCVKPDLKTFTQMLPLIEETIEAENKLIKFMEAANVIPDIGFYNALLKKRCLREDYEGARNVTEMIEKESKRRKKKYPLKKKLRLKPNILTYGVTAMACRTQNEAEKLLQKMTEEGLKVNAEILGILLRNGTAHNDFSYILYIMDIVKKDKLPINQIFLSHLEDFNKKCDYFKYNGKMNADTSKNYQMYVKTYKKWLKDINTEDLEEHPWNQFREAQPVPFQRDIQIKEPKKFYKGNRRFIRPYRP